MADASPLPFPSPSAILGLDSADSHEPAAPPEPPPERPKKHAKRQSNRGPENTKRSAARKGPWPDEKNNVAGDGDGRDAVAVKPKQTKSRNGCSTCKLKRLKCGEEKPGCLQCAKRGIACGGYKKTFQWREFPNTGPGKGGLDKGKQANAHLSHRPRSPVRAQPSASTSPIAEWPPPLAVPPQPSPEAHAVTGKAPTPPPTHTPMPAKSGDMINFRAALSATPSASPPAHYRAHQGRENPSPHDNLSGTAAIHDRAIASNPTFSPALSYRSRAFPSPNGHPLSPSTTEFLPQGMLQDLPDDQASGQDFVTFSVPQDLDFPYITSGNDPTLDDEYIDLIGPIQPTGFEDALWPSQSSNANSPFTISTPDNAVWSHTPPFFQPPDLPLSSHEFLLNHFDKVTCGILSVVNGPHENPWRTLVLPLASRSEGLYHALLAMSAFHAAMDQPQLKVVGGEHKQASIRHISDGIRDDSMGIQTQIATALALAFAESWDQHTTTGVPHIKGAAALVKKALQRHSMIPLRGVDLSRLKFLCNAWVYMDVIARLTGVTCDERSDFDHALWTTDDREIVTGHEQPGFGIDFGMPIDARLDPFMGCAGTLFPIIGHVANLVRRVCRSQNNRPTIISDARDLMEQLQNWETPAYIERPEDAAADPQHALQTAEAYRFATMLHLHQAVPELPSRLSDDNHAQRVLQYLATVPLNSNMLTVHIYPLMVAGCMASEAEDRDWVRGRWDVMRKRKRIGVIDKCLAVTEEVWRRKGDYEAKSPRQRNLVVTAELSPAHQRAMGQPERMGSQSPEPGYGGMVYSLKKQAESEAKRGSQTPDVNERNLTNGKYDVAYTVRGHLHWVGVMWDWAWEVLLG